MAESTSKVQIVNPNPKQLTTPPGSTPGASGYGKQMRLARTTADPRANGTPPKSGKYR